MNLINMANQLNHFRLDKRKNRSYTKDRDIHNQEVQDNIEEILDGRDIEKTLLLP